MKKAAVLIKQKEDIATLMDAYERIGRKKPDDEIIGFTQGICVALQPKYFADDKKYFEDMNFAILDIESAMKQLKKEYSDLFDQEDPEETQEPEMAVEKKPEEPEKETPPDLYIHPTIGWYATYDEEKSDGKANIYGLFDTQRDEPVLYVPQVVLQEFKFKTKESPFKQCASELFPDGYNDRDIDILKKYFLQQ